VNTTELDEMIRRAQADHKRLHEAWHLLSDQRDDVPTLFGTVNIATSTISAHLDALYLLRTLLDAPVPIPTPKGA
jgi:hypothetical protein